MIRRLLVHPSSHERSGNSLRDRASIPSLEFSCWPLAPSFTGIIARTQTIGSRVDMSYWRSITSSLLALMATISYWLLLMPTHHFHHYPHRDWLFTKWSETNFEGSESAPAKSWRALPCKMVLPTLWPINAWSALVDYSKWLIGISFFLENPKIITTDLEGGFFHHLYWLAYQRWWFVASRFVYQRIALLMWFSPSNLPPMVIKEIIIHVTMILIFTTGI